MKQPGVFIVGAGPGDPSLISVRGRRFLQAADVVIYDHRVHGRLLRLAEAPVTTILFSVLICGVGLAYVLVESDRWSPGPPYEAYLQNRAFVIGAMSLLWVVMGWREVQRIDDLVARLRTRRV